MTSILYKAEKGSFGKDSFEKDYDESSFENDNYSKGSFAKDYGKSSFGKDGYGKGAYYYDFHDKSSYKEFSIYEDMNEKIEKNKLKNLQIMKGDLINMLKKDMIDAIGHQCNCCSRSQYKNDDLYSGAKGFAKEIYTKIKDSDAYSNRPEYIIKKKFNNKILEYPIYINEPGTISLTGTCITQNSEKKNVVINLFSQFTYGQIHDNETESRDRILGYLDDKIQFAKEKKWINDTKYFDTQEQRIIWLKKCLNQIPACVPSGTRIGIPWKIGCNLGGGDWNTYYDIIYNFAESHPKLTFILAYFNNK